MKLWRCIWANGEVSFTFARTFDDAVADFDAVGEADEDAITELEANGLMLTLVPRRGDRKHEIEWELSEIGDEFGEAALDDVEKAQLRRAEKSGA